MPGAAAGPVARQGRLTSEAGARDRGRWRSAARRQSGGGGGKGCRDALAATASVPGACCAGGGSAGAGRTPRGAGGVPAGGAGAGGGFVASSRFFSGGRLWYCSHCCRTSCFFSGGRDLQRLVLLARRLPLGPATAGPRCPSAAGHVAAPRASSSGNAARCPAISACAAASSFSQSGASGASTCLSAGGREFHVGDPTPTGCASASRQPKAASARAQREGSGHS